MQAISSEQRQLMMRKMFTNHFVNNDDYDVDVGKEDPLSGP